MVDVARAAGVSKSTVSLALGGSLLIPAATREKVEAAAARLGYRRDPLLSALSSRRRKRGATTRGAIALIPVAPELTPKTLYLHSLWRAAKAAAPELGYSVDEYPIDYGSEDLRRLAGIWRARGVVGILWGTRIRADWIENFPWEEFSSVTASRGNTPYPLHIVNSDLSEAVLQTWRRIETAGYRRVAVLIRRQLDESMGWRLSLLWKGVRANAPERFVEDGVRHYEILPAREAVAAWFAKDPPDIVAVDSRACCETIRPLLPRGCHLVAIGLRQRADDFAGMYHPADALVEVALQKLDGMIRTGERGLARNRHITLVAGKWMPGESAPGLC
jgi:Transcriptional regulators